MKNKILLLFLLIIFIISCKKGSTIIENDIYYTPKIDNLRLRESEGTDGKFIRLLKKGEKLKLIQNGKSEIINNINGKWVMIETDNQEKGWCFDAYLNIINNNLDIIKSDYTSIISAENINDDSIKINWDLNIDECKFIFMKENEIYISDVYGKNIKALTNTQNKVVDFIVSNGKTKILFSLYNNERFGEYKDFFKDENIPTEIWEIDFKSKKIQKKIEINSFTYNPTTYDIDTYFSKSRHGLFPLMYDPKNNEDFIYWQNDIFYYKQNENSIKKITEEEDVVDKVEWIDDYIIGFYIPYEGLSQKIYKKGKDSIEEIEISKKEKYYAYGRTNRVVGFIGKNKALILKIDNKEMTIEDDDEEYGGKIQILDLNKSEYTNEFSFNDLRSVTIFNNKIYSYINPNNNNHELLSGLSNSQYYGLYEINSSNGNVQKIGDFSGLPANIKILGNTEGFISNDNIFYGYSYEDYKDQEFVNGNFIIYNIKTKEYYIIKEFPKHVEVLN